MTDDIKLKIKAEAFLRMTGMLPGNHKDEWTEWQENNKTIIFHLMNAVEHVLEAT